MFDAYSATDLAYFAGIVDGEGTVTVLSSVNPKTGTRSVSCRLMVPNTYQPLIVWLAETFGGRVSHYGKPRSEKHKQVYMWYVSAKRSVQLCELILPYLKVKRRHAEIVVAISHLRHHYSSRGRAVSDAVSEARVPLLAEIRELNHRGVG